MNKISACLIVYNEEAYIERALDSLKNCVDEIIVVHDGICNDRTIDIARKYTDKVFTQDHYGACEGHYKFAFSQAKYDWILKIDADEFLSKKLQSNLRDIVNSSQASRYLFLWTDYREDKKKVLLNKGRYKPFLFYKPEMISVGILHFPIISRGKSINLDYHVLHHYKPLQINIRKNRKWVKIQAKQLIDDDYNCFQGDKSDYNLSKWHDLFIKHPLSLALFKAGFNSIQLIVQGKLYYFNPLRASKIIINIFLYNLYLARAIYILNKNK